MSSRGATFTGPPGRAEDQTGMGQMTRSETERPLRGGRLPAAMALAAGGLGGVVLSWVVAQHSLVGARWPFVLLIAAWVPLWGLGVWGARRLPTRTALAAVLLVAVVLRLAAATGTTASISNDAERYAWDAHVQLSGIDPYRYPPDAAALRPLRTDGFWPSPDACRHIRDRPGCTVLNRPEVRTIYPAAAEAWFVAVSVVAGLVSGHGLSGVGAAYRPWQLAGGLVDDLVVVLLICSLRAQRKDPRLAAWYALSPMAVIEFAGNGHVDVVALALLLGALLALRRHRPALAGVLIGAATMVKLYPALALVAGWRHGRARMVLAAVFVMVLSEAPHVWAVGSRVLGYLPGYLSQEHYENGGRFLLLGASGLPGPVLVVLATACLVGAVAAIALRPSEPEIGLAVLLTALVAVTTPVQPWYPLAAAGVALSAGVPALLAIPLAGEVYYAAVILHLPHQTAVGRLAYGIPLLAACGLLRKHGRRSATRPQGW